MASWNVCMCHYNSSTHGQCFTFGYDDTNDLIIVGREENIHVILLTQFCELECIHSFNELQNYRRFFWSSLKIYELKLIFLVLNPQC